VPWLPRSPVSPPCHPASAVETLESWGIARQSLGIRWGFRGCGRCTLRARGTCAAQPRVLPPPWRRRRQPADHGHPQPLGRPLPHPQQAWRPPDTSSTSVVEQSCHAERSEASGREVSVAHPPPRFLVAPLLEMTRLMKKAYDAVHVDRPDLDRGAPRPLRLGAAPARGKRDRGLIARTGGPIAAAPPTLPAPRLTCERSASPRFPLGNGLLRPCRS
jgi:hypothetical protein